MLAGVLLVSCGRTPPATPASETREAAYRANNRGVGLLEQFAFDRAIPAFEEALRIDPAVRLARINLAIALFYAQRTKEAATAARAAQADDPEAPEPAYLLGLIARADGQVVEAIRQFERVLRVDPDDAGARVNLAMAMLDDRRYQDAAAMAEAAAALEPYNATAAYTRAQALTRGGDRAAGARALQQFEQLRTAPYAVTYAQGYLQQGRYAEAVASTGLEPELVASGVPAVAFVDATAAWLAAPASLPSMRATVALADLDADGDLDLVTGGASVHIFRNDRPRLIDVTATALAVPIASVAGIVAGDMNNDGRADLVVLSAAGTHLLTQAPDGRFPMSRIIDRSPGPARSAALVDADHDGDLDVVIAGRTLRLLRNNGNATFVDVTATAALGATGVVGIATTDFDNRRDIDILAVVPGRPLMMFRNVRTGAFEEVGAAAGVPAAADYTAMAIGDVNKDGFTDVLLGSSNQPAAWMLSQRGGRFRTVEAPAGTRGMKAVQVIDYDNDGLLDVFASTADGPRLFRQAGNGWQEDTAAVAALRGADPTGAAVATLAAADLDLDGDTDLVAGLEGGGVRVWRNDGGNANRSMQVALTGRASNRAGVGAKVEVRSGRLYQRIETAAATPPVAPADITVGLSWRTGADAVRVLWPSGVLQTEFPEAASRLSVTELDRTPSSCPYLYTWNGERFEFVTDFLGGGEMGYLEAAPNHRNTPDPDEYVRITDTQMRERDGRFELRVTNELEETLFLDHLALGVIAHPSDVEVFPDEGMRARPNAFRTYTVRHAQPPRSVLDDHGHDVTASISARDRRVVDDFELLDLRGYAREHALVVDLAGAPPRGSSERTTVLLTGWTDYAFSTHNVAAGQRGLSLLPPTLQVETSPGAWKTVNADAGIPVGRPQTVVLDVTSYVPRRVRILTSMRVYWDEVLVGTASTGVEPPAWVPLGEAVLGWRGFSKELDYAQVTRTTPWKLMPGRYTREGDVRELLEASDDRFVISRPGDEIVLTFDASALPPLPQGMRRTFLLYTVGYSKEMDLHSASPDVVAPLPFRAMTAYPFAWPERYPHEDDVAAFHTRVVPRAIPSLVSEATR